MKFYEVELSLEEIQLGDTEEGVIAHWMMNENEGVTVFDHSGNQNHGQLGCVEYPEGIPTNCDEVGGWAEYITGCVDPLAENYNPNAIDDDDSCLYYEGDLYVAMTNDSEFASNGSEERPYTLIQEALDNASEGHVIHVATGTYEENIMWPGTSGIKLYGEGRDNTFIDGMDEGTVIEFISAAVIDT